MVNMELRLLKKLIFITLLIFGALVSQSMSRTLPESVMIRRHKAWMAQYGRVYRDSREKDNRFQIFKSNVGQIESFNSEGNKGYKLAVNEFADLTNEEFRKIYVRNHIPSEKNSLTANFFRYENVAEVPPAIDWRKKGAVTPIRDQNGCGDSWASSAVDSVEGIHAITTGKLITLSVQEILDCGSGCLLSSIDEAFKFVVEHGLTSEEIYPSKGTNDTCDTKKEDSPVVKISGYEDVPMNSEEDLLKAVANQPVSAAIDASGFAFQFYSSGVFTGDCGTDVNHGITIVGYATRDDGTKYWLLKNSWGPEWGEKGYIRIQRFVDAKEGKCGIAKEPSYPIA